MAYSEDLREKVVEYVGRGNSAESVLSANVCEKNVTKMLGFF